MLAYPNRSRARALRRLQLGALSTASASALLVAIAAPSDALAQGRQLNFEVRARAQYDSNVARESKESAEASGLRPDDIRYSLSATVNGARPIGRQLAFLRGTVGYDFYQYNPELKRTRADISGGTNGPLGPCRVGTSAGYVRTFAETAAVRDRENRDGVQNTLSYGANAACPVLGSIGSTVSVIRREVTASGSDSLIDSHTTSVSGSLGYVSRTLGSIGLISSFTKTGYGNSPTPAQLQSNGFENYSIGLQYSRPIGTKLSGSASVSRYELKQNSSGGDPSLVGGNTSGTTWNINFLYRPTSRLQLSAGYSDSVGATYQVASSYQREKRTDLSASYSFSQRLNGSLNAQHVDRSFSGRANTALGQPSEEQRTRIGGTLSLAVGRMVSLTLDASRDEVETDQGLFDYTADRVGIAAALKF